MGIIETSSNIQNSVKKSAETQFNDFSCERLPRNAFVVTLKFAYSKDRKTMAAYVTYTKKGRFVGVNEDSELHKRVVVLGASLQGKIRPKEPYHVVCVPMASGQGYVAIKAKPVLYDAEIIEEYRPGKLYLAAVKFGYKTIRFNPMDMKRSNISNIPEVLECLNRQITIADKANVIALFKKAAYRTLARYQDEMGKA